MTLEKAIEIMIDLLGETPQYPPNDRRDAVKIGIEATVLYRNQRIDYPDHVPKSLDGET